MMWKLKILNIGLFILMTMQISWAEDRLTYLFKLKPSLVDSIHIQNSDTILYLPFGFNRFELKDTDSTLKNLISTAWRVDLVYSTFKQSESFNQEKLNQKRLKELSVQIPELFTNDIITWKIIGQNAYRDLESAKKLYSGFVFHLHAKQDEVDTRTEAESFIKSLIPFSTSLGTKAKALEKKYVSKSKKVDEKSVSKTSTTLKSSKSYVFNCLGYSEIGKGGFIINTYRQSISPPIKKKPSIKGGDQSLYKHLTALFIDKPKLDFKRKKPTYGIYSFRVNSDGKVTSSKKKTGNTNAEIDSTICHALTGFSGFKKGDLSKREVEFNVLVQFNKTKQKVFYNPLPVYALASNLSLCSIIDTSTSYNNDLSKLLGKEEEEEEDTKYERSKKYDSTIFKILDRNKQWKKMMVVADLTGSMSPYTVQLLIWFKQHQKMKDRSISFITFFNDGNRQEDFNKKMGKVGGLYSMKVNENSFDSIALLAQTTILNGNGGDIEENNLEAILYSMEKCKDYNEIVMIADNNATPRDLKLASKITKPIKLILCGTRFGINTAYLNFIKQNGGSVHTFENDLNDLMNLKEGEKVKIDDYEYQIKNGKFIRTFKL